MTAFSTLTGQTGATAWAWDLRSVNGRGLDLRLRLPDGIEGLEAAVRKALGDALSRGNVTVGLRLTRDEAQSAPSIDPAQLDRVLEALDAVQDRAVEKGITLGQPTAADVLGQKGVLSHARDDEGEAEALRRGLLDALDALIADFLKMREAEGKALHDLIAAQLATIETLVDQAAEVAAERGDRTAEALRRSLDRITAENAPVDADRLAQELALIAVKSDITEELDRLGAHVAAGRALLAEGGAVGRKLDFLSQEFNREANTLCSKAQDKALTRIGLDLKAAIDQMREQIQNVE